MSDGIFIKREQRVLTIKLTEEERQQKAMQAADRSRLGGEKRREADEQKEVVKALRAEQKQYEQEAGKSLEQYRTGEEEITTEIEVKYDETIRKILVYRTDTGEVIEQRDPSPEERQSTLEQELGRMPKKRRPQANN